MAAWIACEETEGPMTRALDTFITYRCHTAERTPGRSYQLHPAQLVHQGHVAGHDLLQGVVEFAQLLQRFLLGLVVLLLLQVLSVRPTPPQGDPKGEGYGIRYRLFNN